MKINCSEIQHPTRHRFMRRFLILHLGLLWRKDAYSEFKNSTNIARLMYHEARIACRHGWRCEKIGYAWKLNGTKEARWTETSNCERILEDNFSKSDIFLAYTIFTQSNCWVYTHVPSCVLGSGGNRKEYK